MGVELAEVEEILEAFDDEAQADDEKSLMETVLSGLCHSGIVYPDSAGMTTDAFEWIALNAAFVGRWFRARGDRFLYDPLLRMAYVTPLNPSKRRAGNLRLSKEEILVGCALRANFEQGLREGEENRVKTNIGQIQVIFRSVLGADGPATPSGKRINDILLLFRDCHCVRIASGPLSEEREVTILPGITVLFSNEFIEQVRDIQVEDADDSDPKPEPAPEIEGPAAEEVSADV